MAVCVGDRGTAMTALRPQGLVRIAGDRHDARSERSYIEAESEIVVVNGDQLGLVVRQVEPGRAVKLRDHGRPVYGSFGEKVAAETAQEAAEQARRAVARQRYGLVAGGVLGAAAAVAAVTLLWTYIGQRTENPWAVAAAVVAVGAVVGLGLFRALDAALGEMGGDYWRFTTASVVLGLTGGVAGAVWGIPALGLGNGLLVAFGVLFVLSIIAPVVGVLVEWLTGGGGS